ncbi:unnamed protein product [Calypogeia fissa]
MIAFCGDLLSRQQQDFLKFKSLYNMFKVTSSQSSADRWKLSSCKKGNSIEARVLVRYVDSLWTKKSSWKFSRIGSIRAI